MIDSELAALNVQVAKAIGLVPIPGQPEGFYYWSDETGPHSGSWCPTTSWEQGGPLIEKEAITIWQDPYWWPETTGTERWLAGYEAKAVEGTYYSTVTGSDPAEIQGEHTAHGETMLIAAMRAIVNKAGL